MPTTIHQVSQKRCHRKLYGGWSLIDLQEAVLDIWDNEIIVEDLISIYRLPLGKA
jgi:hypothetical protein